MLTALNRISRQTNIILYDFFCVVLAYYLSYVLRFESFLITDFQSSFFMQNWLINASSQTLGIVFMGVHRGQWRFISTSDLTLIIKSVVISIGFAFAITFFINRLESTPRSIYLINFFLLVFFLSGGRLLYRLFTQRSKNKNTQSAILIGAGYAGEQFLREFKRSPQNVEYEIKCILDDDEKKIGRTLHGIKVSGSIDDLPRVQDKINADLILIAIPSAPNKIIRQIYSSAKKEKTKVLTLPSINDLLSGKVLLKQMREVQVDDLVGRNIVNLNLDEIAHSHKGKTILITGAGGSIGSELCRQILKYNPKKMILIDNSELNIYKIIEEFSSYNNTDLIFQTISVYDKEMMEVTFKEHNPSIIYHAAAYKHVPIVEQNPLAAIKTNILGTNTVAELSIKYRVENFILISTDKAVNPTNIMGTTKRIAEMICEKHSHESSTPFSMVRFGNVLGSSGSVIPKFKKQIAHGGPITVTHPEVTRFFMTIPEAVQLVIQAGCLARGGEIFALDMGTPIKIVDLARELISLAGYEADTEINIEYTGLKPGEKLFEEVLADSESTLPTKHPMVKVAKTRPLTEDFDTLFKQLINIDPETDKNQIKSILKKIVQDYSPQFESRT